VARTHRIIPPLTPQDILRFWEKVRIRSPEECWPWQAQKAPDGRGRFLLGSRTDGSRRFFLAHRIAWTIAKGPIPGRLYVCHHCDIPLCQNPRHLFLGTQADNMRDMQQKGRQGYDKIRGERNGRHTHPERTARGERGGNAKLTDGRVREIRRRYAAGNTSLRFLAREYGIGQATVWYIVHRATWAHVV